MQAENVCVLDVAFPPVPVVDVWVAAAAVVATLATCGSADPPPQPAAAQAHSATAAARMPLTDSRRPEPLVVSLVRMLTTPSSNGSAIVCPSPSQAGGNRAGTAAVTVA